jgi:2-amino-4-hydroxy-6-hydroxymethyldihydropteridine diphosphokinase
MGGVARPIVVALGSNLGDRTSHLRFAITRLDAAIGPLRMSSFHDTAPAGVDPAQPRYLNAVVVGASALPAREVLAALLAVERDRGRERPWPGAPRTLDLVLVLCGDEIVEEPGLQVPHPRFRERTFVLEPLAEIAPGLVDPVTGLTVAQLLERLVRQPSAEERRASRP